MKKALCLKDVIRLEEKYGVEIGNKQSLSVAHKLLREFNRSRHFKKSTTKRSKKSA